MGKVFVRYPEYDFIYYGYSAAFPISSVIRLDPREHKAFKWVTPEEALSMPLIKDEDTSIRWFYESEKTASSKEKNKKD